MRGNSQRNRVRKSIRSRRSARVLNQGYGFHGASQKNSMAGWASRIGSVIDDVEHNIPKLRERSRDLYMGAPLATGALKSIRTSVVGTGLKLNSRVDYEFLGWKLEDADKWETQVEREFSLWADGVHCDAQRMNNFYQLQQLAFMAWLQSGDAFSLLPVIPREGMTVDLRVQVIEADRVCSPRSDLLNKNDKIINGVEIGEYGEVVAYHVADKHPASGALINKWTRIEKFGSKTGRPNILHLMETERPEQRRGVPILAPVIESLKQLARYTEAELMAAVVSGMYTVFIKTTTPDNVSPFGINDDDEYDEDGISEGNYELGNGAVVALGENESIDTSNPTRPNTAFDGFVTSICRQIGAALEIPYEVLLKHFTASYSASRGALLEAWKMYRMRRSWLASDFCQPIYEEFLSELVAKGRISAPGFFSDPLIKKAYCGAEWNGPSQGQLDPLKEVDAAQKRVENGFSTRARETVELTGGDFFTNYPLRVVEEQLMEKGGLKQNVKATGDTEQSQNVGQTDEDDSEDDRDTE
ncbi:phage portal protein [Jeotgalibacillus terrae]|uniref:Phage portal protein n=1 Tax=Jeotgalibacillus terrae TaxID=587735 RepID=A0ABW5ZEN1_9BACL|nr:phage portal protein [Jeotgalibacillus terrae]MBM7580018.1 lambda family phage portal protein [Jeotgalibacillus terrae]